MLVNNQSEIDKGKLTAVANFEKLTFRAWRSASSEFSKIHKGG